MATVRKSEDLAKKLRVGRICT